MHAHERLSRDPWLALYLYYCPATMRNTGGLLFCSEPPANLDYVLAGGSIPRGNHTVDDLFDLYWTLVCTLPILDGGRLPGADHG